MNLSRFAFVLFLVLLVLPIASEAQVRHRLSFQGLLKDITGALKPDGPYILTFSLYDDSLAPAPIWSETKNVQVKRALFSTLLGDVNPLDTVKFNRQLWVGIKVASDLEMTPRLALTSVAYSWYSHRADSAGYADFVKNVPAVDSARIAGTIPDNRVTSATIIDGTIQRVDVSPGFKAPYSDTADFAKGVVLSGTAGGDLTGTYPDPTIANGVVTSAKIAPGTIQRSDVQAAFKAPYADTADYARASANGGSQWTTLGANVYYNSGNVGIGTPTPGYKLDVAGTANATTFNVSANSAYQIGAANVLSNKGTTNIFVGEGSGSAITTGNSNVALGYQALIQNNIGSNNAAIGSQALFQNNIGSNNAAVGSQALYSNTSGTNNTAIGIPALKLNTTGNDNTAAGNSALYFNLTGNNNTAAGTFALEKNKTGSNNTACGDSALRENVAGSNATAIGFNALYYSNNTAIPFTNYNVAVGFESLRGSIDASANTGNSNTALGYQTLWNNSTGNRNTGGGFQALYSNTTGFQNIAIGGNALYSNTTGKYNSASGDKALYFNTTGDYNTATGGYALYFNTTGNNNTALGSPALYANTTGVNNTAVGYNALNSNTAGDSNTAVGNNALQANSTGTNLTAIGYGADVGVDGLTNATAIGFNASVSTSNTMIFGNGVVVGWGFGTSPSPGHALEVGTNAGNGNGAYLTLGGVWTNASDRNKKENFLPVDGDELLKKLGRLPISMWNYKGEGKEIRHIGPMAQDFRRIFQVGNDDKSISTIDPAGIALAAIQALDKRIRELAGLKAELSTLRAENAQLKKVNGAMLEEQAATSARIARIESTLKKIELMTAQGVRVSDGGSK